MWWQLLLNGIWQAASLAALAAAFSVYFALVRAYNFTVAIAFVCGGYTAVVASRAGLPDAAVCTLSAFIGCALVAMAESFFFGPLRTRHRSPAAELVGSLGLYIAAVNLLAWSFGNDLRLPHAGSRPTLNLLDGVMTRFQVSATIALTLALILLLFFVYRTSYGLLTRAIADNRVLAEALGLPIAQLSLGAGAILGLASGLVGAIHSFDVGISPDAGMRPFLMAAVATIVGGRGGVAGTATAALGLAIVTQLAVGILPGTWAESVAFVVLLAILMIRPHGLFVRRVREN